jgi:hypothetical protein
VQESVDPTWHDEERQECASLDPAILRGSVDLGYTGIISDFFHENVIGPSYIPPQSQPNTYNFASASQYGLQTPPPMHESQT